jgi:serine/threonine protein kinase
MTDSLAGLRDALADRYTLEPELGQGGMATVYLAHDQKLGRLVALKALKPELAAVVGPERFRREIEIAAKLTHPNILGLYDCGTATTTESTANGQRLTANLLYYTMPYVEGESLRDRLTREKQLPLDDALQITKEVADALGYAHALGLVHRDIKPENILFQAGHALVADFGIAKAVTSAGGERLTETGLSVGTPAYMSPEQAGGHDPVDGRSDLYSLGCVLYEMLAGHPPFTGSTAHELLARQATDPVPPLRTGRATIPEPIEAAVERVLSKVAADRYATAQRFSAALQIDATAYRKRQKTLKAVRWLAAGVVGAVVIAAAVYGTVRYQAATSWKRVELDPNAVAIMPFEVRATDPALATLDEGIIDFLYPILSGDAGPRAIEPSPFLFALRERRARGQWGSADAALRLAAQFRASQVLEGRLAQVGPRVTLSAWLRRVPDGATIARLTVSGAPDSVLALIQQLAMGLLGSQLGESEERLADLVGRPPEAVAAYFAGTRALRLTHYDVAIRSFGRALELDSTFALAALRLIQTPGVSYQRIWQVLPLARAYRASLGGREQAALTVQLVWNRFDTAATSADGIAAVRRWLEVAPDEPEGWLAYAVALREAGSVIPVPDWEAEARRAFERSWSLDSTTPQLVERHVAFALGTEDLGWLRRVGPHYLATADTLAPSWIGNRWVTAVALGDSATVRTLRSLAAAGDPRVANWAVSTRVKLMEDLLRVPRSDGDLLDAQCRAHVLTSADSAGLASSLGYEGLEKGRIRQLADVLTGPLGRFWNTPAPGRGRTQVFVIGLWLIYPGLDSVAALAAESLRLFAAMPRASPESRGVPIAEPGYQLCYLQLHRAARGDTVGVRAIARRLEPWFQANAMVGVCPALVEALVESHDPGRQDTPALDRLEALLRRGTGWEFPTDAAIPVLARLLRRRGEYDRALAVSRMHALGDAFYWQSHVALLREEGNLAGIVGDTTGAIEAYRRYLAFRTDPDDLGKPQVDSVRAALNALLRAKG